MERLKQIMDSFFSKMGEKLAECAFDNFSENNNFESNLEIMKRKLRLLCDRAFDVEEEIKKGELSGKKKPKREIEEWLKKVKTLENKFRTLETEVQTPNFVCRFLNGDQATQLSVEVDELVEQSHYFGELLVDDYKMRGEALLTTELSGKGFKQNLNRIWNLLKSDKVSSLGIYGMGGVGKTALARHINNMIFEKRKQKRVYWIMVSQVFSIKKLQDEIARFIGLNDLCDEDSEDKRAARLNRAISVTGNDFILILDDVWEYICLQKLGDPLHLEGCKLILTTRSLEVCRRMGCQENIEVKKLHTDEAWNLFKQKLGQDIGLAPEVEKIAKSMAKVCGGLPLGIIVLAGSMRGETSIHVWRNELEKLRDPKMMQDDDEDEVFKVLKYSFDRLDLKHQQCFLHCSLYPEDWKIHKEDVVERFISVELVDIRKSRQSQLDQGHSILDKLLKVCLLESVTTYAVKMHDLVRAMALKLTKEKNMTKLGLKVIPKEEEWTKELEVVYLAYNHITKIPDGMSPDCHNLTTLILSENFRLRFISDSFFSKLDSLCALDLSLTGIEKLPNSLSYLKNLKSLNLSFCHKLVDIPDLGNLKKLRELNLSRTKIKKLPQGMEELVNLRFLSLGEVNDLDILPIGLFLNFRLLQYLWLPLQINAPVEEIVWLKHLDEFVGQVENVSDFNKYFRDRQNQSTIFEIMVFGMVITDKCNYVMHDNGRSGGVFFRQRDLRNLDNQLLTLEECTQFYFMENSITEIPDGMFLDCHNLTTLISSWNCKLKFVSDSFFSKLDGLCALDLFGTDIEKLPNSLSDLENLKSLQLRNCKKLVDIPDLGNLKKLRELDLLSTKIKKLPQGMEELVNLRFLSLGKAKYLDILPKGLFLNFQLLQHLWLPSQINAPVEEIVWLKHLEKFVGQVENVSDFNKYIRDRQNQSTVFEIMVFGMVITDKWNYVMHDDGRSGVFIRQRDLKNLDNQFLTLKEYTQCDDISAVFIDADSEIFTCNGRNRQFLSSPSYFDFSMIVSICRGINKQPFTVSQELKSRFLPLWNLELILLSILQNFDLEAPLPKAFRTAMPQSLHICFCTKNDKVVNTVLGISNS